MIRRQRWLPVAAVIAVAAVVNIAAASHDATADLSAARRFTLAPATTSLLHSVHATLRITAFLRTSGPAGRDAKFLLGRFRDVNGDVDYDVIDPDANPGVARRLGVGRYSTVVLTYRGRRVDAPSAEELDLDTAILRLVRGGTRTVCPLVGHGEPALDDTSPDGLSSFATLLANNAYDVHPLDLTVGATAVVPTDCNAVLVVGPRDALAPREVGALAAYEHAAGRVAVLASPLSNADPNPLLQPWGVGFAGGLVLDPARSQGLDLSNVIVEDLPTSSPVVAGVDRVQFPATGGLVPTGDRDGLTVARVAVTSDQSWIDTSPDDPNLTHHPGDVPGPILVAAAADDSRVEAAPGAATGKVVRTRVFVTGTDSWISNRFIDSLGNRRLAVNALAWLTQTDDVVAAVSRPNPSRPLPLTAERQARVLAVTVGVVPAAILAAGLLPWYLTRRRRAASRR